MNGNQNKSNSNNQSNNPQPTSLSRIADELKELNSKAKKRTSNEKKEDKLWKWDKSKKDTLFWVQVVTLFGTVVALMLTIKAINKADDANKLTEKNIAYSKQRDKTSDSLREITEKENGIKYSIDTAKTNTSIRISNELAKASIQSLKDAQQRFEKENESFFGFIPIVSSLDSPINIKYKLFSYGKTPLIVTNSYMRLGYLFGTKDEDKINSYIDTLKEKVKYGKYNPTEIIYVPNNNGGFNSMTFQHKYSFTNVQLEDFKKGYSQLFIYGKIKYVNTVMKSDTMEQKFALRFWFENVKDSLESGVFLNYISVKHLKN